MALPRAARIAARFAYAVTFLAVAATADASMAPIERLAGTGTPALYQDVSPKTTLQSALSVQMQDAGAIALEPNTVRDLVFVDTLDNRIFELRSNGTMTLFAGNGQVDPASSGPRTDTALSRPEAIAVQGINSYLTSDYSVAGSHLRSFSTFTGAFDSYAKGTERPRDFSVNDDPSDLNIYMAMAEGNRTVQTLPISHDSGTATTVVAGGGTSGSFSASDPLATEIGMPWSVSTSPTTVGAFVVSTDKNKVFKVTNAGTASDTISVVGGGGADASGADGPATSAALSLPSSVLYLKDGGFLVYDAGHARIRRVSSGGTMTTVAGNGTSGLAAPGTPANIAPLITTTAGTVDYTPADMEFTPDGLVFTQGPAGVVQMIPATAIVSGPAEGSFSNQRVASFGRASWDDKATFQCSLDGGSFTTCADTPSLADGQHTFQVKATTNGPSGTADPTPASRTWTVDATPPSTPALIAPGDGQTPADSFSFSWNAASDATSGLDHYEIWVDGKKATDQSSCADGVCTGTPPEIGDGTHSWEVHAVDKAGNVSASAARTVVRAVAPKAVMTIAPTRVLVGRTVAFDATASNDPNGSIVRYEWDLDGDGTFETDSGATPTVSRSYAKAQTIVVGLRVTDNSGLTGPASGQLVITVQPPSGQQVGVSINDGAQYTNDPNVTVFAVWPTFASNALISNDGGFKKAELFPVAAKLPWKLDSSGPERLPKTIYVRFTAGSQTSQTTFQDDIILDETPPKVLAATISPTAGAARAAAAKVTLRLKAKDNVSGVGRAQVTKNKRKPGKLLKFKKTLKVTRAAKLFVRVRDRAGNFSTWRTVKRR